ncbi:MAG: hypothetical protein R2820_13910 [Cyclobacteriaceae bacterium]
MFQYMADELGKPHEVVACLLCILLMDVMVDGVEAVEDKVRVDLRAEGFHLHFEDVEFHLRFLLLEVGLASGPVDDEHHKRESGYHGDHREEQHLLYLAALVGKDRS